MPGPRTIRDILASPSPRPAPVASPAQPRTIQDILRTPASPAAPSPAPRPTRSIQDIIGASQAAPRFEMPPELPASYTPPPVDLPRPSWEPPPSPAPTPTPRPQASPRPPVQQAPRPFVGPIQKPTMAQLVTQERARLEAEPWPTHISPRAGVVHNLAAPALYGLKVLGEGMNVANRAIPRFVPGYQAMMDSLRSAVDANQASQDAQSRAADAALAASYQGAPPMPSSLTVSKQAPPTRDEAMLEQAKAAAYQQLYGDPRSTETYVQRIGRALSPVGDLADPRIPTVGEDLGEATRNPYLGMAIDSLVPFGPVAGLQKVTGAVGRIARVGEGVAARLAEGEGRLAELARVATLPVKARPSEAVSLLRNAMRPGAAVLEKPPVAPTRSIQDILSERPPAQQLQVEDLERLGDNLGASHQGNLQAQRGMPRLAEAERQALVSAPDPAPAPEPLPAPAVEPPAPVQAPEPVDTRGQGVQYHGSSRPVGSLDEGHYENRNIYGQGFYTTDALDVAKSYTGKGAKHTSSEPSIYQVREREPVSFFNLDQSMRENPAMARAFTDVIEQSRSGVDEALAYLEGDNPTFSDLLDEMRRVGVPRDEVQEVYDAIQHRLRAEGYGGWQHVGGKLTGKAPPHQVKIYFDPAQQLELTPHGPQAPERVDAPKLRESAPRQPVSEGLPPGVTRETVDPRTVQVDARSYQFKSGGDAEGVTEALHGVKRWDASKAGTAIIHERLNGERFVADGHQRTGLARRLAEQGESSGLNALVYREADGFSVKDMRVIGAAVNLAQDSGSAIDAAKVIKAFGEGSPHLADIPKSSVKFRDGRQLAKLGDEAFEMVVNGAVEPEFAAHVGKLIADPAEQAGAMRALARIQPHNSAQALSIVQDIRAQGMATRTEQGGLFGAEHFAEDLLGERARIFAAAERLAKDDKALFNKIVQGEGNLEQAGNVLAKGANRDRVTDAERLLAGLEEAKYRGPVNDRLNQLSRELKSGSTNPTAAARSFLDAVRSESELAGAARAVPRGSLADAGGVADQVEQIPDIQGQNSLFLDSAPVGVRPRSARAQVLDNAPATAPSAPPPAPAAPPVERPPSKPFWSRLFDRPLEQRVKSQMQLNRELQDTLGMVARGEHEAPPTMFERLQNTLSGNTSPRVTYGKLAPAGSGAAPAKGANGATGRYHLTRDLIEVRNPGSPGVMFHEAGHAIDTHTGFVKNAPPEIAAELERFGDPSFDIPRTDGQSSWAPGLSKMRKRQEGMAEFLRVWMNHPDFDLKAAAPKLSEAWEQFLDGANDVGRRLRRHQADARTRLRSSDQAKVRAQIVEENAANAFGVNDVLAAGFDRYRWMQVMDSTLAKNAGRALTPDESSYVAARMLAGLDNVMGSWIHGEPIGFNREATGGKSLEAIFAPLQESPAKYLDFRDYLVTRRANELHGRGMKSGMDADGVGRVMAELEQANPEFAAMAQDVYAWNDGILQYAHDAGFLSESALESIRELNRNYIPFHRIYETAAQEFGLPRGTGGGLQASERIRAIKGSMREIVDPIETMMANAAAMISSAEKNRVGQILLKHWDDGSEGIGHFVREVSEPQRMIEVNPADSIGVRQIQEALEGAGIPTDGLAPEQLADLVDLLPQIKSFQKTGQLPENTVRVKVQVPQKVVDEATGAERMTTVDRWRLVEMKPEIYKAFTAMDEDQVHWAVNAMSGVANLLRAGATKYSPVFIINNAVRDSIEASTVSRLGSRTKGVLRPFEPLVHAAHGMRATLGSALGRYLEAGLGQAMEDVSRFTVGENLVPTGVRQVADKVRMDAPAWMTKADELMTSFIREGGMQGLDEMLTSEAGTRAAYNRVFGRMNPKSKMLTYFPPAARPYIRGAVDLATLPIRTPAAIIRMLSEGSEQMTRISEFEKGLEVIARENPKWTPAQVRRQAAFEARDLLDFSVHGSQLRAFRRMVPFLGSQMTGNYRVAQNILEGVSKGNGWGSLGGAATKMLGQAAASITLPTMMLYALNYDDDDYNQLPQDERDTFWHLRVGRGPDDFLRIAKPHFLGATFASAPERFMQRYLQNDPEAFHGFLESMVKHTMGPFGAPLQLAVSDKPFAERIAGAADLLGPAGKTVLELATNHDFFRNRDIEAKWTRDPDSSAYLPSYLRSDEYSSLVARTMARTGLGKAVGISPQQIDHAINNFTGTGGRLLVNAELDPLLATLGQGDLPKQRRRKWGGLGYTENRYASEERMLRENQQLQDLAGEARALERDLPEETANRHADVRDAMHELKQLRKELKNATESEAVDIRRQIRELTAAISPPPGGKP